MSTVTAKKRITNVFPSGASATFTGTDFTAHTGNASLQGPLSLAVNIDNNTGIFTGAQLSPVYVGIKITTINGVITIGDRKTIGFVGARSVVKLTGSSIPQLSRIEGIITRIEIITYIVNSVTQQMVDVWLEFDAPFTPVGSLPYIGTDEAVYKPAIYIYDEFIGTAPTGATTLILSSTSVVIGQRLRLISATGYLQNSATAANLLAKLYILDDAAVQQGLARIISDTIQYRQWEYTQEVFIPVGYHLEVNISNSTGSAANVGAFFLFEQVSNVLG